MSQRSAQAAAITANSAGTSAFRKVPVKKFGNDRFVNAPDPQTTTTRPLGEVGNAADIACCNHCYADFLAMWPHAYDADNNPFQTTEIYLDWFYEAGYLKDEFSKEEFDRYIAEMHCPRCGSFLAASIWAYEFPFEKPDDFEVTIREVSERASSTPFLLLENEFCKQVLAAVRDISKSASPKLLDQPLFRARSASPAPHYKASTRLVFRPQPS